MPHEIVKRDGSVVPFQVSKIESAVGRCLDAVGVLHVTPAKVAEMVERVVARRVDDGPPTVEQVQDSVELVLLALDLRPAAVAYMTYRDQHAAARAASRVRGEVREAFAAGAAAMGDDPLRVFQFMDKYARWRADLGRRETWLECVDRSMAHLRWLVVRECGGDRLTGGEWAELRDAVVACDAMPSMRLLSQAGEAARRDDVAIFNCAYQAITDLDCFRESLLISMAGCGDAYSVESQFVRQLPMVRHQRGVRPDVCVVADTSEGWGDALLFGLERWFDGGDVVYDYSGLRQAGAPLRTKGGQSSGPGPLRFMLNQVRRLVLARQGSQLRPVDVNDVLCLTGEAGNSGGQRRTAKLSLSDWGDTEMRDAKSGDVWYTDGGQPWRGNANNSASWPQGGPTQLDLIGQMHAMYAARSGERGIFSRHNALRTMPAARAEYLRRTGAAAALGTNPCGEIYLQSRSFCNLTLAVARPDDDLDSLRRKVRVATVIGTIQSLATRYDYLRPEWGQHGREERLLGVDVTGQMDCRLLRAGDAESARALAELRAEAWRVNSEFAGRLGIAPSMAITCNKPSGNSSTLLDCAPGINARKVRWGVRNARVSGHSPVYRALRACGVPMDPENGQVAATATTWVVHFPIRAPDGSLVESERTALQQLDHWLLNKRHWTDHNPSVTVTYSPDEMIDVVTWVWEHRDEVGGISFLPRSNTVYRQLPYEETSREEYEARVAAFPAIDWSLIASFEAADTTTSSRTLACGPDGCELA